MFTAHQQNTVVSCMLNSVYNSLIDLLVAVDRRLSGSPCYYALAPSGISIVLIPLRMHHYLGNIRQISVTSRGLTTYLDSEYFIHA